MKSPVYKVCCLSQNHPETVESQTGLSKIANKTGIICRMLQFLNGRKNFKKTGIITEWCDRCRFFKCEADVFQAENSVDKDLKVENSGVGFIEMSQKQHSGSHESAEGGKRKKKNKDVKSDNFDENGYEETPGRKEKKKKIAGIETQDMLRKNSKKRKSKGLLDGEIEERPLRCSGGEKDNFNENMMEEKPSEYSGSEHDSFRENSIKEKDLTYDGSKKVRAMEESVRSEGIREEHVAEKEKKKKKKHGLGQAESEEFEESIDKSMSVDKSKSIEESCEKSTSVEGSPIKEKSSKKKNKNRADGEETVGEFQNSKKSTSIERTEEGFDINKERPGRKKKKKKRAEGEEIKVKPQGNISKENIFLHEKVTKEKGIYNVAAEEADNRDSSANAKSKEKIKRKRKEREIVSGDDDNLRVAGDADKSRKDADKSSTDGSSLHKKKKKVTFSNQVQVCGTEERTEKEFIEDSGNSGGMPDASDEQDQMVWAKRFDPEEDQAIRDAISKYIKEHDLDEDEGIHMILNCKKYRKIRNCWTEISAALPWRPYVSVYNRGHMIFERSEERCWTQDEIDGLRRLHNENGKKWSLIAKVLGKSRYHVKDKWRAIKRGVMKRGHMSQDEYQRLFDLVNYNLELKQSEKHKERTRQKRRDNLNWEVIADKMGTRDHVFCCRKWYGSLVSSLIEDNLWENGDDKILLRRLLETNASDEDAVDWDDLVKDRSGEICHKRWKQMVKHLGEYRSKPFCEKLDLVARRYAPELTE